jgi:hypothetical protein
MAMLGGADKIARFVVRVTVLGTRLSVLLDTLENFAAFSAASTVLLVTATVGFCSLTTSCWKLISAANKMTTLL